jgi:hypothetical protein
VKKFLIKIIVKLRMLYADLRGHHGKRWNYEPSKWYMGKHNRRKMKKKKKAPKGYHYMPNGKLMKNSAMKKNKMKRY